MFSSIQCATRVHYRNIGLFPRNYSTIKMLSKLQVAMKTKQQQVVVPSVPLVPSEFGLGVQEELETVSEYVTEEMTSAPVNNSVGISEPVNDSFVNYQLSESFIKDYNDSNVSDFNLSAISLQELNESGSAAKSPTYGSAIRRSRNINNEINYSEVDGSEALVDNDDDMDYKPVLGHKSKRPLDQEDVVAEYKPIKRGRGRPPGSKKRKILEKREKGRKLLC